MSKRKEHGFLIKDINLFKKSKKDKVYNVKLETDLPEMNSIKDFATWLVKEKLPLEQKLKFIQNIKEENTWDEFHTLKSNNPHNPQLIYERDPEKDILDRLIYDLESDANILDLGCGDGADAIYFSNKGFNVSALDISKVAIEIKSKNPEIDAKVYDISKHNLPYSDNHFDLIFSRLSLHYFDRFTLTQIVHDINNKMKDGGCFYLTVKTQSLKDKIDTGKKFLHKKEWIKVLEYYFKDIHITEHSGKLYNIYSQWLEIECIK